MRIQSLLRCALLSITSAAIVVGTSATAPKAPPPGAPSFYYLSINGAQCGWLTSVDLSHAVTHAPGHAASGAMGSVKVVTGSGMNPTFYSWLHGGIHGTAQVPVTIYMYDSSYTEAAELQIAKATFAEAVLPTPNINVAPGTAASFTITISSADMTMTAGSTHQPAVSKATWSGSKFKLSLGTLDCSGVMTITPLDYRPQTGVGIQKNTMNVTVNNNNVQDFVAWFNAFNTGKQVAKTGTLTMYADDGSTVELVVNFTNVNIKALNQSSQGNTPVSVATVTIDDVTISNK
jgi:hypothetical protein